MNCKRQGHEQEACRVKSKSDLGRGKQLMENSRNDMVEEASEGQKPRQPAGRGARPTQWKESNNANAHRGVDIDGPIAPQQPTISQLHQCSNDAITAKASEPQHSDRLPNSMQPQALGCEPSLHPEQPHGVVPDDPITLPPGEVLDEPLLQMSKLTDRDEPYTNTDTEVLHNKQGSVNVGTKLPGIVTMTIAAKDNHFMPLCNLSHAELPQSTVDGVVTRARARSVDGAGTSLS